MRRASGWFCLACLPVLAQEGAGRARRVIDNAVAALGGPAFLHMNNRVESGRAYSFYRERLSGLSRATIYTRYLPPRPGVLVQQERQAFGKKRDSAVLFTGGKGYEITFRGARPIADNILERHHETTLRNIFYILRVRLDEPGLTFDYRGSEVLDNQPVDMVDITDSDNRVVTAYFNQTTRLPSRQVTYRRDPQTRDRIEEITLFAKYRDAGGVMWPFDIQRQRDGEKVYEMYSDSVSVNVALNDALFTLPAGMKILKTIK